MHAGFAVYKEIDIFLWLSHAFDLLNMDPRPFPVTELIRFLLMCSFKALSGFRLRSFR